MKKRMFRAELEMKMPVSGFVEVEAKDSTEAFQKLHQLMRGEKVKGIFRRHNEGISLLEVRKMEDVVFPHLSSDIGKFVKIAHLHDESK